MSEQDALQPSDGLVDFKYWRRGGDRLSRPMVQPTKDNEHRIAYRAEAYYRGHLVRFDYWVSRHLIEYAQIDLGKFPRAHLLKWCQDNAENLPIDTPAAPVV